MTVNEYMRSRLLANVPDVVKRIPNLSEIIQDEWSWGFVQHCLNRCVMGRFRYGSIKNNKHRIDRVAEIKKRADLYAKTGNTEYLCDISNLAHLEYINPAIPDAAFTATDDGVHFTEV